MLFGTLNFGAPAILRSIGPQLTPEATSYLAAMSVQPDNTRKNAINNLITALKTGGVWSKLDWLSLHAAHDEQAARINAVTPAQIASVGVAPTFTVDRGHTGNGTSQYLNTGWNPSSAGGNFVQNDCHIGAWIGTDATSGSYYDVGNSNAAINGRSGSSATVTAQSASASTGAAPTAIGHLVWVRTGASAGAIYKGGESLAAIATASTALRNASFLICAANASTTGTVTAGNYSTRRVQAVHWGSQLSAGETLALYNALASYMTAVGA